MNQPSLQRTLQADVGASTLPHEPGGVARVTDKKDRCTPVQHHLKLRRALQGNATILLRLHGFSTCCPFPFLSRSKILSFAFPTWSPMLLRSTSTCCTEHESIPQAHGETQDLGRSWAAQTPQVSSPKDKRSQKHAQGDKGRAKGYASVWMETVKNTTGHGLEQHDTSVAGHLQAARTALVFEQHALQDVS